MYKPSVHRAPRLRSDKPFIAFIVIVVVAIIIFTAVSYLPPMRGEPAGMATKAPADMLPTMEDMSGWDKSMESTNNTTASVSYEKLWGYTWQYVDYSIVVYESIEAAHAAYDAEFERVSSTRATADPGHGDKCFMVNQLRDGSSGSDVRVCDVTFVKGNVIGVASMIYVDAELSDSEARQLAAKLADRVL
jgi:hypothetical protein